MAAQKLYQRSWKAYLLPLILSIILLPAFGLGLIGLLIIYNHRQRYQLIVKDVEIHFQMGDTTHEVALGELNRVELLQTTIDEKLNIGNLRFTTLNGNTIEFNGIDDPRPLVSVINKGIVAVQRQQLTKPEPPQEKEDDGIKTGALQHMNDLVGLWQQGLIDDDAFEEEKKKFSNK